MGVKYSGSWAVFPALHTTQNLGFFKRAMQVAVRALLSIPRRLWRARMMVKNFPINGVAVFIIIPIYVVLSIGVFSDQGSAKPYAFWKHRPSTRVFFADYRHDSETDLRPLSTEDQEDTDDYIEFVYTHGGFYRSCELFPLLGFAMAGFVVCFIIAWHRYDWGLMLREYKASRKPVIEREIWRPPPRP
jgi:hypothetical protein